MNPPETFLTLFAVGAAGGLVKELLNDGCIELPKITDGKLALGFISAMIIGGFAGYFIDGSLVTAFGGGLIGSTIITKLIPSNYGTKNRQDKVFDNTSLGDE